MEEVIQNFDKKESENYTCLGKSKFHGHSQEHFIYLSTVSTHTHTHTHHPSAHTHPQTSTDSETTTKNKTEKVNTNGMVYFFMTTT